MKLFNHKKKKGFTIVELVIVIAVIAVLAAILIPTFVGLVDKANVAADGTLVRELNNALALDLAEKGETKHETMTDALEATKEYGFDVSRISTKASKNKILWDSVHGVFCYLQQDATKVEYVPGSVEENEKLLTGDYRLWTISNTVDGTYSTYLYKATETTFETTKGFDAGNENVTSVTYNGGTNAQDVVIRTNGGTLTVNAPADTVNHYGDVTVLNIEAVDTENCYREFGTVANAQIKKGKIVIESAEAKVENLLLIAKADKNGFEKIVVETKTGAKLPTFDRTDVNIDANGTLVFEVVTPTTDDFIYLTKAGVIEQVVVTTEVVDTNDVDVTTVESAKAASEASTQTYNASKQIANVGNKNANGDYVDANNEVIIYSDGTVAEGKNPANIAVEAKADETAVQTGLTNFSGGVGTEKSPFLIASEKDWETLATLSTQNNHDFGVAGYSYKVVNDLDMSYILKADRLKFRLTYFHGTIDFDNHQMTWMTPYNAYPSYLIENSNYGCTIKNANFNLSGRATIIYDYKKDDHMTLIDQNIVLQNINIYGNIVAYNENNYAPFCSNWMSEGSKLTMINCNNYCNITSSADNTGIFAGRTYGTTTSGVNYYYDIELINCNNYGTLINGNGNAGMLFSNGGPNFKASKVKVENCGNYGTIIGKKNANLICGNLDEKYYVKTNANYDPNNNVEGLEVSNKQNGVCGKANIATLNVENGNFVLPQTANAEYYVLSFVTTYNDGGGATTGIAYRFTEEQRAALELKEYEFSVGEGSNETTGATAIPVGDGTLYVKDGKYLFINDITSLSGFGRYITRQPAVSFMAFDANGNLLAAYNYTYSN